MKSIGRQLIIALLLSTIAFVLIPLPVHAANPTVSAVANKGTGPTSSLVWTSAFNPSSFQSNTLVLDAACTQNSTLITSIGDSAGLTWNKAARQISKGTINAGTMQSGDNEIWVSLPGNNGAVTDTLTINFSPSASACIVFIDAISSVFPYFQASTSTQAAMSGTITMTTASQTWPSNAMIYDFISVSARATGCANNTPFSLGVNSPLVQLDTFGQVYSGLNCLIFSGSGFTFESGAGTSTFSATFTGGGQLGVWGSPDAKGVYYEANNLLVIFTPQAAVVQTVYAGCTFFQEQCWVYPLFFLGLFGSFWIGIGIGMHASDRGLTFLAMSAITYGTIIEIMMGMLAGGFMVLVILVDIVYALALSGVF